MVIRKDDQERKKRINKVRAEMAKIRPETLSRIKRCQFCMRDDMHLVVHHIIPVSRGGDNSPENLLVLCDECHKSFHSLYATLERNLESEKKKCGIITLKHGFLGMYRMAEYSRTYLDFLRESSPFNHIGKRTPNKKPIIPDLRSQE